MGIDGRALGCTIFSTEGLREGEVNTRTIEGKKFYLRTYSPHGEGYSLKS
jgi:hypothetical protein